MKEGDELKNNREHLLDERSWDAEKRDFVADRREDVADEREAEADAREAAADEREAELDERERQLNSRGAELGLAPEHSARPEGEPQKGRRDSAQERAAANSARADASKKRDSTTPTTGLAMAFAGIAAFLYESDDVDQVLDRIVGTAAATILGCAMASITVRDDDGGLRTVASTDTGAVRADQCQYEAGEGPCLDALETAVVYTPSLPDPRWPRLKDGPVAAGVQSVVSYRLAASRRSGADVLLGSLNNYAEAPNAFPAEAQEVGLILAAHASVAVRAVSERQDLEHLGRGLREALASRDVIGQAKGILMERLRVTPDEAFDLLRRASQRLNLKLREVADGLSTTGQMDEADASSRSRAIDRD
jgi:hypothetical protein